MTIGALNSLTENAWNMISIPSGKVTSAAKIMATGQVNAIWGYENDKWILFPSKMVADKGYWVKTNKGGTDISNVWIIAETPVQVVDKIADLDNIKKSTFGKWELLGTSYDLTWAEVYSAQALPPVGKTNCIAQIYYYDTINASWNTTDNIPANSGIWVKQNCQ